MTLTFLYFNKDSSESSLSDRFHKRKWWACLVYRAVLALAAMLAATSLGMSSYAVYQVTMDEKGCRKGGTNSDDFYKPHEVEEDKHYRMWNPVSMSNDGLLQLNPSDGNVYCNGSFSNSGSKFPSFIFFVLFDEATWKYRHRLITVCNFPHIVEIKAPIVTVQINRASPGQEYQTWSPPLGALLMGVTNNSPRSIY